MRGMMRSACVLVAVLAGPGIGIGAACAADDAAVRGASSSLGVVAVYDCERSSRVTVRASSAQDAQTACEGALRALDFLAKAGLEAPSTTTIEIVPGLPGELAGRALGCYMPEVRRILLVDFDVLLAGGGWYRMPASRELYRAVASHEVAPAVVGRCSAPRRLPVAAHEYVAYVVMFATMDSALRAAILARFPDAGFETAAQISDLNHLVARTASACGRGGTTSRPPTTMRG